MKFSFDGVLFTSETQLSSVHIDSSGTLSIKSQVKQAKVTDFVTKSPTAKMAEALDVNDVPVLDGTPRGSLRNDIVPNYFKEIGTTHQILANDDDTVRSAFYFNGMAANVTPVKKITPRMKAPFLYNVTRKVPESRPARRKGA